METVNNPVAGLIDQAPVQEQTRWTTYDGEFERKAGRVLFTPQCDGDDKKFPFDICADLKVSAITRDYADNNYGYLVAWTTLIGRERQKALPAELLQERDGSDLRKILANAGLDISTDTKARKKLSVYIQTAAPKDCFALCTDRLGWYGDIYITPDGHIGQTAEKTVFQSAGYVESAFSKKGAVEDWKGKVASLAADNSRMMFGISCAFAAPLMYISGESSGGFHLAGPSSSGKTTALNLASSVYGKPSEYTRSWRATANGLEGIASLHNDGLLVLDELSQVDARQAGEVAYMLGNGQGKTRANQQGDARKIARWRLLFLSSGEESLESVIMSAGHRIKNGQSIRLVEIDADAGAGMGAVESLNGYQSAARLTMAMNEAAEQYYGTVGFEWLQYVVANRRDLAEKMPQKVQAVLDDWKCDRAGGQIFRVAKRFALVAVAGEIASQRGLTGWTAQQVHKAVEACFLSWRRNFGEGNREEKEIIENMNSFLGRYGDSRFEDANANPDRYVQDRLGFKRTFPEKGIGYVEYCIPTRVFREHICSHFQHDVVCRVLKEKGILQPGSSKNAQSLKFSGQTKQRYYVLRVEESGNGTAEQEDMTEH